MKNLLIKNGRVIDPANHIDKKCDVLIADGKFAEVGRVDGNADMVIDAEGKLVLPGLIDIHVHFREPGDEEEETIASGSMVLSPAVSLLWFVCPTPTRQSTMRRVSNMSTEWADRHEKRTFM
jgi:dihydroorotase-like cyclic amidohydrolase